MVGMHFEREQCLDFDAALARTWMLTDGSGALAAGTVLGCPVSRRHGLLAAPFPGAPAPHLFLARLEEHVLEGGRALPLSTACYPGALYPAGHTYLAGFDAWPHPRWLYRVGEIVVTRELRFAAGRRGGHTLLVRWTVKGPAADSRRLTIRPLLACREAGALTFENPHLARDVKRLRSGFVARPYPSLPPLAVTVSGASASFTASPDWFRRIEYPADLRAGLAGHEDHFTPGMFTVEVGAKSEVVLAATTGPAVADPRALWHRGRALRRRSPTLGACLARAATNHLVRAHEGLRVLARLPEGGSSPLESWEALPGLLLAQGRIVELGETLVEGRDAVLGSLAQEASASRAVALAWARAAGLCLDRPLRPARLARRLETALLEVGAALQAAPEAASPPDVVAQARWYALAHRLAARSRGPVRRGWTATLRALGVALLERFGPDDAGPLHVTAGLVAAAAEARSPLSREQRLAVVARARTDLLTPRGLRSVSPGDPGYRAAGAVSARWVGPYVEASLLAEGRRASVRARLTGLVEGFLPHLSEHGLGHVAEAFDGDPPHAPSGAPSEACAVAGLLWAAHLLGLAGA